MFEQYVNSAGLEQRSNVNAMHPVCHYLKQYTFNIQQS